MHKVQRVVMAAFLINTFVASAQVFAEEQLSYMGDQRSFAGASQGGQSQQGSSALVPVSYGTNYEAQFSPYASFMQPPMTTGGLQQQYAGNAYTNFSGQPFPPGGPAGTNSQDPYAASEVSPYSHYSPYIEVVGEGSDYTLGIDDVVTIVVRNQPDFSGRFVVDPEGNIQYNFVGGVKALGKTKDELKADITEELKQFIRYPEVAVMISQYNSKFIYVFGYVNSQGKFAMKGDHITVKEAIVAAGLPREDGSMKRVYVIRPSNLTPDGKAASKKVNLKDLIIKGNSVEDFVLEPGDTIVVHQKYFDRFVNTLSKLVGPIYQSARLYELGYGTETRKGGYLN